MWLKINYEKGFEYEVFEPETISVTLSESISAPVDQDDRFIRLSRIFPLMEEQKEKFDINSTTIYFFDYDNAFRILGKIKQVASTEVCNHVYYSYGCCSIIFFATNDNIKKQFFALNLGQPRASETWFLKDQLISRLETVPAKFTTINLQPLHDYSQLPLLPITILDEFAVSIKILESRADATDTYSVSTLQNLVLIVNIFIKELNYLYHFSGPVPDTLYTKDSSVLKQPLENQIQRQQIIDRLIQINSSLSYISTQSFSGSVPILERRSLIRRSSLLGIGGAIRALNRIVDYIEEAFYTRNFQDIILGMEKAIPLKGLGKLSHDRKDWYQQNIDTFRNSPNSEASIKKMAYYSSRQAYRESEYAITASLNSVWTGISLEWTLMTITHEMLHSHVRMILTLLFYKEDGSEKENYQSYYDKYSKKILNQLGNENYSLIDSIRESIFSYCVKTIAYGSLTVKKEYDTSFETNGAKMYVTEFEQFYAIFQQEYRNLNEIFVHVLDLHYFYGGRTSKYIPLIWCSWSAVPHVNGDIRQYILRSLLAIASKIDQEYYERWELAIKEFKEIIQLHFDVMKNIPIVTRVLAILNDTDTLTKYYFGPFKNSLIIVDLAVDIFFSKEVNARLWDDENISFENSDDSAETEFSYNSPLEFIDTPISCPVPYLFDRMIRVIKNKTNFEDIERLTAMTFLGINSK